MEKGYIVLTPEKIDDIFRDLQSKLDHQPIHFRERIEYVDSVL